MTVSIIIVNYKTPQLVADCINSVLKQDESAVNTEIIVVDNHSEDGIEETLIRNFPSVRYIQMGYNAGFARANNAGIRIASGDIILLLNSDTLVEENAINKCCMQFMSDEYVACGVQLLNEDRTPQISGNYAMKGGLNYLLPLPFLGKALKFLAGLLKMKKPNVPDATGTVEVDWINGAFLMVKKTAIEKAGLLDEDFFLYAEEAEWCSRLKKTGKLCIYGDHHVVHLQGATSEEAFDSTGKGYFNLFDKRGLQIMVSNFLRIRKEFGLFWFFVDLFFYIITIPVFFVGLLLTALVGQNKYSFAQWLGYTKNIMRLVGLSGKMITGKKYFYKVL
ncbi:glycosyltransferase family 2 protein [Ferruginibacter sp. SUN002]|uniref:glycosyltransferase family 2 protein n=1 Tax=Ferruginibacter sp. SUN002 TaxID=2937789 RepID=UPI003D35D386